MLSCAFNSMELQDKSHVICGKCKHDCQVEQLQWQQCAAGPADDIPIKLCMSQPNSSNLDGTDHWKILSFTLHVPDSFVSLLR